MGAKQCNLKGGDIVIIKDDDTSCKLAAVNTMKAVDRCIQKVSILVCELDWDRNGKCIGKPMYLDRPIHKLVLLICPSENK